MARLWVCLRCSLFLIALVAVTAALFWGALHSAFMMQSMRSLQEDGALTPWSMAPSELLQLIAVSAVSCVMVYSQRRLQKKNASWRSCVSGFLMADRRWARKLLSGISWGCVCAAGVVGVIGLCGGYQFHEAVPSISAAVGHLLAYAVTFLIVGLTEELIFRGYLYAQLTHAFGFQKTAFATSLLFGLVHMPSGTPLVGAVGAGVAGYVFCFMVRHTGSLFFPVGFHAAWDWTQTAFFGVNDSGHGAHAALLQTESHGPYWLTGGSNGPEASAVCFIMYGALILFYHQRHNHMVERWRR